MSEGSPALPTSVYRALLRDLPSGAVAVVDRDLRFQLVEGPVITQTGYTPEELLGKTIYDVMPAELAEQRAAVYRRALAGETVTSEFTHRGRHMLTRTSPVADENGDIVAIRIFAQDVSAARQAELDLAARARQQAGVARLGQQALVTRDLQPLMEEAVELVADTLGVEYTKVLQLLADGKELLLRAGVGWSDQHPVGKATVSAGLESQAGYTLLTDQPVIVRDLRTETRFSGPPLLHNHKVVSGISVIIGGVEAPWGVFGAHTTQDRIFTRNEVDFLWSVANVLAAAIDRDRVEQNLREQNIRLTLLSRLAGDLLAAVQPSNLFRQLFEVLARELDVDCGASHVIEHRAGGQLQLYASFGLTDEQARLLEQADPADALWARVAESREPIILGGDELEAGSVEDQFGLRVCACYPLLVGERFLGTITFGSRRRERYSEAELSFFRTVSLYVALAEHRLRSEQALRNSEARYRTLLHSANDAVVVYNVLPGNQPGPIIEVNDVMCERLGYSRQEMLAMTVDGFVENPERVRAALGELVHIPRRLAESTHVTRDGRRIPVEVNSQLLELDGRPTVMSVCRDITERKEAERQLRESQAQLQALNETLEERVQARTRELAARTEQVRALASELTLAEQRERYRLAQVLHDEVQQMLVGMQMSLHLTGRNAPEDIRQELEQMQGYIDELLDVTRTLTVELSSPARRSDRLRDALRWLAEHTTERYGLAVELDLQGDGLLPDEDLRELVVQLVRELLFNVVKHAGVERAQLSLFDRDGDLCIQVVDTGTGFDVEEVLNAHRLGGGFGLFSVRERLVLFGGRLDVESLQGQGTRATITLPHSMRE